MFVVWNVFIVIIGGQLVSYQKYKNRIEICKKRFQKCIITHLYNINDKKIVPLCSVFKHLFIEQRTQTVVFQGIWKYERKYLMLKIKW